MTVMPCGNCGEYVEDNIVGTQCKKCGWKVGDGTLIAVGNFAIDVPDVGTGTMRSSGTYIALLLQLEGEKWAQIDGLTDVMELMGITLKDMEDRRLSFEREEVLAGGA